MRRKGTMNIEPSFLTTGVGCAKDGIRTPDVLYDSSWDSAASHFLGRKCCLSQGPSRVCVIAVTQTSVTPRSPSDDSTDSTATWCPDVIQENFHTRRDGTNFRHDTIFLDDARPPEVCGHGPVGGGTLNSSLPSPGLPCPMAMHRLSKRRFRPSLSLLSSHFGLGADHGTWSVPHCWVRGRECPYPLRLRLSCSTFSLEKENSANLVTPSSTGSVDDTSRILCCFHRQQHLKCT